MKILLIHQNFPGQFRHLAPALAARGDHVTALTLRVDHVTDWQGVHVLPYVLAAPHRQQMHPWLVDLDSKVTRGEACWRAACQMRDQGYVPDLILAHPGWGEAMFLADVWPRTPLSLYCELYHRPDPGGEGPDPDFPPADPAADPLRLRLKNLHDDLVLPLARAGLSPTRFQADSYPDAFRPRITVQHDGVDTHRITPRADARLTLPSGRVLTRADPVVTFANRRLEPFRGLHDFLRTLPALLRDQPRVQVVIAGRRAGACYGPRPPQGTTWTDHYWSEISGLLPPGASRRIHFAGPLSHDAFIDMLRISAAHVYLTRPFVPGWSLVEAMAAAAPIVASDTAPVREFIQDGETGLLTPQHRPDLLAQRIAGLLENPQTAARLGGAARELARDHYDLHGRCLPRQLAWVDGLA